MSWNPPSLSLIWPPFFRADKADEQLVVATTAAALQANMITRRMALEKIRPIYPYENMEAVLAQLDEEAEHAAEHSVEKMLAKVMDHGAENEPERADREGTGDDEEAPASR